MKKILIFQIIVLSVILVSSFMPISLASSETSQSEISFTINGLFGQKVKGQFHTYTHEIIFDPNNLQASKISAVVDIASVDTKNNRRDNHLKSKDYFNIDQHPVATFISSEIHAVPKAYVVTGILTIRGISKPITIPFVVESINEINMFKGKLMIDRTAFNVGKKSLLIGEKVLVELNIPAKK